MKDIWDKIAAHFEPSRTVHAAITALAITLLFCGIAGLGLILVLAPSALLALWWLS